MAGCIEIWSGPVDFGVDGESRAVDRCLVASWKHFAFLIDEHEIRHSDLREVRAQGVDPEMLWVERISQGDVSCNTFVKTLPCEGPEGGGEMLLLISSIILWILEFRWRSKLDFAFFVCKWSKDDIGSILRHASLTG